MAKKDDKNKHEFKKAPLIPDGEKKPKKVADNAKQKDLKKNKVDNKNKAFTTNKGLKMAEDEFSLKAGVRGPSLLEDFHLREKSCTLTMRGFPKESFMRVVLVLTVFLNVQKI